jgi:hypothetical protein
VSSTHLTVPSGPKVTLSNGQTTNDVRLDRVYELDWRSLDYAVGAELIEQAAPVYRPRSYTWAIDEWLDQMSEGACVGFSFAHELAARPQEIHGVTNQYARGVYFDAQRIDPWEGGAYPDAVPFYEGTSVLAGAQILKERGFYESYHWALSAVEAAQGLAYFGPAVLGTNWYTGMFDTDPNGFIHPTGRVEGGHAILIHAVKIIYKSPFAWWRRTWQEVDYERSYVTLWNSWGNGWGNNGKAKLSLANLARLISEQGDVCFPNRTKKVSLV